jgi:hypothetical protein
MSNVRYDPCHAAMPQCCETHDFEISRWADEGGAVTPPKCNGTLHAIQPFARNRRRTDKDFLRALEELSDSVTVSQDEKRFVSRSSRQAPFRHAEPTTVSGQNTAWLDRRWRRRQEH